MTTTEAFISVHQPSISLHDDLIHPKEKTYFVLAVISSVPQLFAEQATSERGFWVWAAEVLSTHPSLSRRVKALTDRTLA